MLFRETGSHVSDTHHIFFVPQHDPRSPIALLLRNILALHWPWLGIVFWAAQQTVLYLRTCT